MAREDLFNIALPQLERWRTGDVVEHHKLNAPLEAIDAIVRGIRPPHEVVAGQRGEAAAAGTQWRLMVLLMDAGAELVAQGVEYVEPPEPEPGEPIALGTWRTTDAPEMVRYWPNMQGRHYQDLIATGIVEGVLEVKHHVVPCMFFAGEWYAMQLLRFAAGGSVADVPFGDCVP